jgi:hypothetical protein
MRALDRAQQPATRQRHAAEQRRDLFDRFASIHHERL